MPNMEYLLGEIVVEDPEGREEAIRVNEENGKKLDWPEGWWAVSDDRFAYLAFFQFEEDAWSYRLHLINTRMYAKKASARYAKEDEQEAKDFENEWVVGTEASNGTFYMQSDYGKTQCVESAHGYGTKAEAEKSAREWGKPRVRVRQRKAWRKAWRKA